MKPEEVSRKDAKAQRKTQSKSPVQGHRKFFRNAAAICAFAPLRETLPRPGNFLETQSNQTAPGYVTDVSL